jgi:hypothetical protein
MGTVTNLFDRTAYAVSVSESRREADHEVSKPSPLPPRAWIEDFPEEEADRFTECRRRGADGQWKLVHPNDYDMFWAIFDASEATRTAGESE